MPGIIRNTIIQGPCLITYASQTFYSKGDVTLKPVFEYFDIETSAFGQVDQRLRGKRYEISFEPVGMTSSNLAAVLWPYGDTVPGTSIFGSADRPLVIHGRDGVKVTVHNAALTRMPAIRLGVGVTLAGACQFTGLLALSKAVTAADGYLTVASNQAYPGDTNFNAGAILTQPALATWGSAPWAAFEVEAPGWEITPTLRLSPVATDGLGTVDMLLQGLEVTARAVPVGPTIAQMLTAHKETAEFGSSMMPSGGTDLVITSGAATPQVVVTVNAAALVETEMVWSAAKKRVAQCVWRAQKTFTTGDPDPLFTVAVS
jgi:hypothetical protein